VRLNANLCHLIKAPLYFAPSSDFFCLILMLQEEAASTSKSTAEETIEEGGGATMEGLARQALLAARVFHLIPVEKARERFVFFIKHSKSVLIYEIIGISCKGASPPCH
jgi:hypothetical protein